MDIPAGAATMSALVALALCLGTPVRSQDQPHAFGDVFAESRDHRAIQYTARPTTDPIQRLNRRIANNEVRMPFDRSSGYLKPVLAALNVPVSSQMVVFAKGSLQSTIISPANPRVIYFGDNVVVAWPSGGFIEAAAVDREQGVILYALPQVQGSVPTFSRRDQTCLTCHASSATLGVPGLAAASVVTDRNGAIADDRAVIMDHRTPLASRWAGWYVTAKRLPSPHLGNLFASVDSARATEKAVLTPNRTSIELGSLAGRIDTNTYPSAHSDVAAHLVFNHQARMINLLTRFGWDVRVAQLSNPGALAAVLAAGAREVVDYMLFVDEARLAGPIEGSTDFPGVFASAGPRDKQGRSLRDLDLATRLLRYPCSYLIYSEQFDGLPAAARDAIYARLRAVLTGQDSDARYRRLSADDRRAIIEILRDTKKDSGFDAF